MRHPQGILVSCELPWDDSDELIESVFRQEIAFLAAAGFSELYICGTAGEGYAIDNGRFRQAAAVFLEEASARGVSPQVGVIALSTLTVLERIQMAWDLGCRSFQVSLPSWGALNDEELFDFFHTVCGSFPGGRFLHYNLPRAKRVLTATDYRRLCDQNPNLVATKNTAISVETTRELVTRVPEMQHYLSEAIFPTGCAFGSCSLLSSFGPLLPQQTQQLFEYGIRQCWNHLTPLWAKYMNVIYSFLEPLRGDARIDGAYDKMIVRMAGVPMPSRLLAPYRAYTEADFLRCRDAVQSAAPDWFSEPRLEQL